MKDTNWSIFAYLLNMDIIIWGKIMKYDTFVAL